MTHTIHSVTQRQVHGDSDTHTRDWVTRYWQKKHTCSRLQHTWSIDGNTRTYKPTSALPRAKIVLSYVYVIFDTNGAPYRHSAEVPFRVRAVNLLCFITTLALALVITTLALAHYTCPCFVYYSICLHCCKLTNVLTSVLDSQREGLQSIDLESLTVCYDNNVFLDLQPGSLRHSGQSLFGRNIIP